MLNHAGVCVSYATAWKYLRQISAEAMYLERIREGHWIWAYDNLNIYQRVRHERYAAINYVPHSPHDGLGWGNWWGNVTLLLEVCALLYGTLNSSL